MNEWMDKRTGKIMHCIVWQAYVSVSFIKCCCCFFAHCRAWKNKMMRIGFGSINMMLPHALNQLQWTPFDLDNFKLLFLETSFNFSVGFFFYSRWIQQAIFVFCLKQINTIHVHGILQRLSFHGRMSVPLYICQTKIFIAQEKNYFSFSLKIQIKYNLQCTHHTYYMYWPIAIFKQ